MSTRTAQKNVITDDFIIDYCKPFFRKRQYDIVWEETTLAQDEMITFDLKDEYNTRMKIKYDLFKRIRKAAGLE